MWKLLTKKNEQKMEEKVEKENLGMRYLSLLLGCLLSAIAFNVFFLPENIVYGGVSGISIVLNKVLNWNPSMVILVGSVLLLIFSYFTLGKEKTKYYAVGSLLYPLCVQFTQNFGEIIQFNSENILLNVLFGAVLSGLGSGITSKSGFSTGGSDIIDKFICQYAHVSYGKAMMICEGFIVLVSGFFLGSNGSFFAFEKVMYAIIVIYIMGVISDKVVLGISASKSFYIITENETEVKKFLIRYLNHGVTVLDGRGGYTGNHQKVIMCIVPTKEYFIVKETILQIDPKAFFVVTDAYEISGGR